MSTEMDLDPPNPTTNPEPPSSTPTATSRTRILTTTTLRHPPWSYIHLTVTKPPSPPPPEQSQSQPQEQQPLDALQLRAYLTAALRQFLGDTGAAIPVDILAVGNDTDNDHGPTRRKAGGGGGEAWVRVPREDLARFVAGVTAFSGVGAGAGGGERMVLGVKACGDWLGSLVGRDGEEGVWAD
ncbi:uncharacterized protein C8A04DRAFT_28567 [Dichotomopilus funicola]|uniref:Ribonucleases P/MRP subunit Pop8-like domain-containing protein n=1 Tax=Dichotomopilus funicola TaxID=1934379 RepID=A0AAN6ZNP8_9PEZI|nr:hypothetical protein C8A04DRAFT_28567 [Dichotomopilus funicola]